MAVTGANAPLREPRAKLRSRKDGAAIPLDADDKRLMNLLQSSYPLEAEPFESIASEAELEPAEVKTRTQLDEEGHSAVPIVAYSVKYASAFYGPFRVAADSAPEFGDRRGYQMNPANADEAVREAKLDLEEGADVVMVKPALPYLDVIRRVKDATGAPVSSLTRRTTSR